MTGKPRIVKPRSEIGTVSDFLARVDAVLTDNDEVQLGWPRGYGKQYLENLKSA